MNVRATASAIGGRLRAAESPMAINSRATGRLAERESVAPIKQGTGRRGLTLLYIFIRMQPSPPRDSASLTMLWAAAEPAFPKTLDLKEPQSPFEPRTHHLPCISRLSGS
jgi:hypothetical protein